MVRGEGMRRPHWLLLGSLLVAPHLLAEIRLPNLISDHAVLQREQPIHLWGTADAQEVLTVRFHEQKITVEADGEGNWETWLRPEHAGGPYTLTVSNETNKDQALRTDILVGDVWLASGQSNMEFPLTGFTNSPLQNGEKEIAQANQPELRLMLQPKKTSPVVLKDTEAHWTLCTPETARNFSAIAYLFGREISAKEKVPIGLIDTTWGGTPAHSWISLDGIAHANLPSVAADAAKIARSQGKADQLRERYAAEDAALKAEGKSIPTRPRIPDDHQGSWAPATLFNAMIAPYTQYTIKGALWYQGETDATADRSPNYERVFSTLIEDWRREWAQGPFPFLFVQISSFGNHDFDWGELRDSQRRVSEELNNVGMAVTLDVGLSENIHPPDKQTVARRLALAARELAYGEQVDSKSPSIERATLEGNSIRVWLVHAHGLTAKTETVGDFEVAGADHRFVPATGKIEQDTIVVNAPSVPQPKYVRYGWKGTVHNWFYNANGLPAGTFTSEK